jgi:hypothetical protein
MWFTLSQLILLQSVLIKGRLLNAPLYRYLSVLKLPRGYPLYTRPLT